MEYQDLLYFLEHVNTDPSRLIFEDELTGIYNRRFLRRYLQHKIQWDSLEREPVSLLMMDVDSLKQINDTYGHSVGDQALVWVAKLIKEVAGVNGLAVRYGGDEFIVLLPAADKRAALEVGEQILQRIREEPLHLDEIVGQLPITLSIGVASAPADVQTGNALIQTADTALYFAKKSGRARLVDAGQVSPQEVFPKTAVQRLDGVNDSGRETQQERVKEALENFSQGKNQFLLIEGAAGMGKSEFLKVLGLNLAAGDRVIIKVNGVPQEGFRPYYLTTNILVEIMNQRPDKGIEILNELTPKELSYLSYVLPQLAEPSARFEPEDPKTQRNALFATLIHMILRLLDSHPLILIIDDCHFSDEATLLLLRRLLIRQDSPLFICGAAMPIRQAGTQRQPVPLEHFFAAHNQELNIDRVSLTPLSATDIGQHLQRVFPQMRLPEGFEEQLAQLTQGNPLFVSEIMRKLILGGKIALTGQVWSLESLEEDYLPRSLEEIVSHKIAVLNKESRKLLDQASTFGEQVSLSMLAGSSETKETQVTEFIDQAVAQGLIGSQYQMNDETIRFLSRRILDITYGAIQEKRKEELHERVGEYQETRNAQRLLLSAATLAYHFQLSANQEKARFYRDSQQAYDKKIFNAEEAIDYTGGRLSDGGPQDVPLNPAALVHVSEVIRGLLTTHRKIKLYPSGSPAIVSATEEFKDSIDKILAHNDRLNITQAKKVLSVNGEPLDVSEFKSVAETLAILMTRLSLQGIAFSRGLTGDELRVMLESLDQVSTKMIDRRFWQRFMAEHDLLNIELEQVRYTTMVQSDGRPTVAGISPGAASSLPGNGSASLRATDRGLDEKELTQLPSLVRSLLTTSTNIKLYPPESQVITDSIEELRAVLETLLEKRPALTLARVQEALLVNGQKVDTKDFKAIADGFLRLLEAMGLRSLSFLKHVSTQELRIFIAALREPPVDGFDGEVWHRLARMHRLTGILFDQRTYGILEKTFGTGTGQEEPSEEPAPEANLEPEQIRPSAAAGPSGPVIVGPETEQLTDAFLQSAETRLRDLFLKGDEEQSGQIIQQLFQDFALQTPTIRTKVIHVCGNLLKDLGLASQPQLVELLTDPLLLVLAEEEEPRLLEEMGTLLYQTAISLIHFADYRRASRTLTHLGKRQRQLQERGEGTLPVFIRELEPETRRVLSENLKSQEPTRLQEATQLLGSLGPVATPLLIDVIKEEDNLEARQSASRLLGELGPEPVTLLKRELVLEGFAQQRVRILEVIDKITRDLKKELDHALEDESPKVRRAAFRLVERSNDERLTSLLVERTRHQDPTVATAAITSLGKIKPAGAAQVLVSLLESAKDEKRIIASCRALGQIADPASIEPLAQILAPQGFFSFLKKRSPLVRATAAFALAQISDPRVAEVLARHLEDDDSRVRQAARDVVNGQ